MNEKSTLPWAQRMNRILAIGRLNHQKGFDVLIETFDSLRSQYPDWELVILGEGRSRESLEAQIRRLGCEDVITLPGEVESPERWLSESKLFVLSSRWEGFSNALLEAMAQGCAVIAGSEVSGVRELLGDGEYGVLYRSEETHDLALAIKSLMENAALADNIAKKGRDHVLNSFDEKSILQLWDRVLKPCES